ncbi:hypothetical protein AB4120_02240 [Cupriavidus sp. 2KB_3]|uniref:hypothetical protein n=1 Tax=Cupriavidus sp. 2KB_3 TaxID=3232980 RepID=UPI003F913494
MRILVQYGGAPRKFVVLESSDRDGSLTLVMRRDGVSHSRSSWSTRPGEQPPQEIEFQAPRPKSKRITIHQSGRINYHENGRRIFVEPLTRVTLTFPIYGYRIPTLSKLDLHPEPVGDDDVVIDLSDLDGPVSFSILLGPKELVLPGRALKLAYEAEGYALGICVDQVPFLVPVGYEDHFTTVTPENGPFNEQQMEEDQALIAYHQAVTKSTGPILYQPNGEGVIRLVFSVPMRVAPKFKIELADPNLDVLDQDIQRDGRSDKVTLKFKVRHRRSGQIIRKDVAVRSIELDAEL